MIDKDLIDQAQKEGGEYLNRLCELIRDRLHTYICRTVLDEHLAEDIVQETITEMFHSIHNLQNLDCFWPWLRGVAFNKVRQHFQREKRQQAILQPDVAYRYMQKNRKNEPEKDPGSLMRNDLKHVMMLAMKNIPPKYRAVLNLRCFENMDYSEISNLLDCSEVSSRVLFYRAKKALQKQLSKQGVQKNALLACLVLFASVTSKGKAANASVAISPAVLDVGVGPVVIAGLLSLKGAVTLSLAGVMSVGLFYAGTGQRNAAVTADSAPLDKVYAASDQPNDFDESWYYFPEGREGPVLQWHSTGSLTSQRRSVQWLQNDQGNYLFENGKAMTHNFRLWQGDLSVTRLPVDSPALLAFLEKLEGNASEDFEPVLDVQNDLLIVYRKDAEGATNRAIMHVEQAMNEIYFKYGRAMGEEIVDLRDAAHKQGWTYFTLTGHLGSLAVSGCGSMPLTYLAYQENPYWLKIKLGTAVWITDGPSGATRLSAQGHALTYPAGHFFQGLARPWMGLHTIDTIRRDAAERQILFSTQKQGSGAIVKVALAWEANGDSYTAEYDIDMAGDRIARINVACKNRWKGQLQFDYPFELDRSTPVYDPPSTRSRNRSLDSKNGLLITELAARAR